MATTTEMHINDIGTVIEMTIYDDGEGVDLSTATLKQFIFKKPDGTTVTKTAAFSTNGADGKLRYVTVPNDLNVDGSWSLQVYVEMPTGKWRSDVGVFSVLENLG